MNPQTSAYELTAAQTASAASIASILPRVLPYVLIAVLILNLMQRRHVETGERKRFATLAVAGAILALYVSSLIVVRFDIGDLWLLAAAAIIAGVLYRYRSRILVFRRNCVSCGNAMSLPRLLTHDSNRCERCEEQEQR